MSQTKHGFDAITPLSAALTLAAFAQYEGRYPTTRECDYASAYPGLLLSRETYIRAFSVSTFRQALDKVSQVLSGITYYTCLGHNCNRRFIKTQSNIRFCEPCRTKQRHNDARQLEPGVRVTDLRRWGADIAGWEALIDWGDVTV